MATYKEIQAYIKDDQGYSVKTCWFADAKSKCDRSNIPMLLSKKNYNNRGFTLGELLIVVGIIGVLIAVAIPIFNWKLESAREAYDIYTMRQAASAAVDLYNAGAKDKQSLEDAGLLWWNNGSPNQNNAAGVYDPGKGTFLGIKSSEAQSNGIKPYGKGTKRDGGTVYEMGNSNGAYAADENYTNAIVMIAIYPEAEHPHADIYWKNAVSGDSSYVGKDDGKNNPRYSIRIWL